MIDALNKEIIIALHEDGRKTYTDLAKTLYTVEGTIRKRVKGLQEKGFIKIIALPDLRVLGYTIVCLMGMEVKLSDLRNVAEVLAQKPNVCYLAFVTGRYDLISIIVARSTSELSNFIEYEIAALPSVLKTETFVNLDIVKGGWLGLDVSQLLGNLQIPALKNRGN